MKVSLVMIMSLFVTSITMAQVSEKELFRLVDLREGQCSVAVQDTNTGWTPEINLKPLTKHFGSPAGGIYLSHWNNTFKDKAYIVSVEYLVGDMGHRLVNVEVYLNYGKQYDNNDVDRDSRSAIILDNSLKVQGFVEKIRVKGPGIYEETDPVVVPQEVTVNSKTVSFSRLTKSGVSVKATCDLSN